MKRIPYIVVILTLAVFSVSCISGKNDYSPPLQMLSKQGKPSIVIDKPKDEVWKTLIKNIGTSFFVINNMDKESGFINLSYSGGDICNYLDCGNITSEITNARGTRTYNFPACADNKQYEVYDPNQMAIFNIERTMKLEGRINIVVQEEETNKIGMIVNIRYIVTKGLNYLNYRYQPKTDTINFDSNESGIFPRVKTECRSTGNLEQKILDLVKQ
jgi:hypothetical protein